MSDDLLVIDSVEDFYARLQLKAVTFDRYSVSRDRTAQTTAGDAFEEQDIGIAARSGSTSDHLLWRVEASTTFEHAGFRYDVAVGADYSANEQPFQVTEEAFHQIFSRSAIVTLAPYLRESLQSLAARVGDEQPVLPLLGPASAHRLERAAHQVERKKRKRGAGEVSSK